MRVCLISTVGGHLSQLERLAAAARGHDLYLVTVRSPHASHVLPGVRRYAVRQILRNPANLLVNFAQSLRIFLLERPRAVLTTGAGDALPTVLVASALGVPVVFVESLARVTTPSLFGRLVRRWCRLVLYQWEGLRDAYPGGVHVSPLFPMRGPGGGLPPQPSILVLTGTHTRGFERLLRALDEQVGMGRIAGRPEAQIGHSTYLPRNYPYFRFLPHEELLARIDGADLLVTHDGSASIGEALSRGKPTIVVPRTAGEGEVSYGSGQELARHLSNLGLVVLSEDPSRIAEAIERARAWSGRKSAPSGRDPVSVTRDLLDEIHRSGRHDPLRIALVSPVNPWADQASGMRVYVESLAAGLARAGMVVSVATEGSGAPPPGVRILPVTERRTSSIAFLLALFAMGPRIVASGDVIHAQRLDHLVPLGPWLGRKQTVVTLHGETVRSVRMRKGRLAGRLFALLEALGSFHADSLIAVDPHTRDVYEAALPRTRGRIPVIPVGVERPPARSVERGVPEDEGIPQEAKVVLFAGRLEPEKNVDVLIEAFPRVQDRFPTAQLILVGTGSEEGRLKALAQRTAAPGIRFLGAVARGRLWGLLRRADVVAIPSRFESGPLVAVEAVSVGTPIVATAVGRIPDLLERWPAGELSLPTPEAFGTALVRVLERGRAAYEETRRSAAGALAFEGTLKSTMVLYTGSRGA